MISSNNYVDANIVEKWIGKRAFILGGGPSLENFDFTPLKSENTIGINKSYLKFPCNINFSMDEKLLRISSGTPEWKNFAGIKMNTELASRTYHDNSVVLVKKIRDRTISFDLSQGIYPGNNSGFGAMMLAIALGANPIYLLGIDMKVNGERTHWHTGYANQSATAVARSCDRFRRCFEDFADALKKQNIQIINLNPDSALKCFEFGELGKVL